MNELERQALTLASGTIASISGYADYATIDLIQHEFVEFCQENRERYQTWQAAWAAYWPISSYKKSEAQMDR